MKKDRPRRPWLGRSRRGDLQNNEFDLTIRPVMVRALIVAHEPRQARVAGEAYVMRISSFPRGLPLDAGRPTSESDEK